MSLSPPGDPAQREGILRAYRANVTKLLADLDYAFALAKPLPGSEQMATWTLEFTDEKGGQKRVIIGLGFPSLIVAWFGPSVQDRAELMRPFLEVNGRLIGSRLLVLSNGVLAAQYDINLTRLNAEALQEAIGSVLTAAASAEGLLANPIAIR